MKKIITFICLVAVTFVCKANNDALDSLKHKLQTTTNDTLKGPIYTQIAAEYLKFDTIVNRNLRNYYQSEAIHWSLQALHNYSFYEDTLGMRRCFDDLAKVYTAQHRYSQAKWFLLQSKNISRKRNDVASVVMTLVKLANVKMDNKETKLAMRDLNDALNLSVKNNLLREEALVQQSYAFLYNRLNQTDKGDIASKRMAEINEKLQQIQAEKQLAETMPKDSVITKKTEPVKKKKATPAKKLAKLNTINTTSVRKLAVVYPAQAKL